MTTLKLGKKLVGLEHPTYFVADIAANYDGSFKISGPRQLSATAVSGS